eukprot:5052352-Pyramimonas_sp.AAC.1
MKQLGRDFSDGKLGGDFAESKAEAKKRKDDWQAAVLPKQTAEKKKVLAAKRPAVATARDVEPTKAAKKANGGPEAHPEVEQATGDTYPVTPVNVPRAKQPVGATAIPTAIPKAEPISSDTE